MSGRFPGGKQSGKGLGGYPQPLSKEGCALSGLSRRTASGSRPVGAHGCAPVPAPDVRPLPWREAERNPLGGWGVPQAPTKEGCALSGLSRRTAEGSRSVGAHGCAPVPAPDVRPLPWREAKRKGSWGVVSSPHQRELRPLWMDSRAGGVNGLEGALSHEYRRAFDVG